MITIREKLGRAYVQHAALVQMRRELGRDWTNDMQSELEKARRALRVLTRMAAES